MLGDWVKLNGKETSNKAMEAIHYLNISNFYSHFKMLTKKEKNRILEEASKKVCSHWKLPPL